MLEGIDVSSWNGQPFNTVTENGYKNSDFIIAKATEGTSYVNPACDYAIQRAIKDGKLWGFYHYANGSNAKNEAKFFYDNCKGYIGKGIPALDWENGSNPAFGNVSWALDFVTEFHRLTNVWPIIYVSESAIWQVANCAKKCGLWVANWSKEPSDLDPWDTYTLWQFTSSDGTLDKNRAKLNTESWLQIAKGENTETKPAPNPSNSLDSAITTIAQAVIDGQFGNGEARKNALYGEIQKRVNEILGG